MALWKQLIDLFMTWHYKHTAQLKLILFFEFLAFAKLFVDLTIEL